MKIPSLRNVFKNVNGTVLGAFMALTAAIAPVAAMAKEHITLDEYVQMQRQGNAGQVHRDYSPYREGQNRVDIRINSSRYGSILLRNFNCETLVPYSPNDNVRQILATQGAIATVHAGLGARNRNDSPAAQRAMEALARGVNIITPNNENTLRGINHLEDAHGIDLYDVVTQNGRRNLVPQQNMQTIIGACANQLNR